jgi:CMP-N,N'-diacetyllegionaminic acid synthase
MNRLCTICARGGSKGVENKNIRNLHGKPLLAYSLITAKQSGLFDLISVSSDSPDILQIALSWGADIVVERPIELASDTAAKIPAIQHCVTQTEILTNKVFDVVVDLDATSPLRIAEDIIEAVELLESRNVSNVITGMPSRRSPYFNIVEQNEEGFVRLSNELPTPIVRRQDAPKCYDMNASIYVWKRDAIINNITLFQPDTLLYIMPEERSIDIDNELDWKMVEFLMNFQKGER